jgi:hypothetical protein
LNVILRLVTLHSELINQTYESATKNH